MIIFSLESLPQTALTQVFDYVEPGELLEFRFLNKYFFTIVNKNIIIHLNYSTYYNTNHFKSIQNDYVLRNSSIIRHLNIFNNELFDQLKIEEENELNVVNKFNNLKSIKLTVDNRRIKENIYTLNNLFKSILYNIRQIRLDLVEQINLERLLNLLNPNKLNLLSITTRFMTLIINISSFNRFNMLTHLYITTDHLQILPNLDDEHTFPALEHLEIIINKNTSIIDYFMFGNINQLKSFTFVSRSNDVNSIQFIKTNQLLSTINFNCNFYDNNSIKLNTVIQALNPILEIAVKLHVQINGIFCSRIDKSEIELLSFKNVDEIIFNDCVGEIQFLLDVLKWFPNVKRVIFKKCQLFNYQSYDLFLPDNSNEMLFCFDKRSLKLNLDGTLKLFECTIVFIIN